MLDEAKKLKIIQLVQSSAILTAQEKTDWLSLLELMNDKQIVELEEILQPKAVQSTGVNSVSKPTNPAAVNPVSKPVVNPVPTASGNGLEQPSLKHISNLPNQISSENAFVSAKPRFNPSNNVPPKVPVRPAAPLNNTTTPKPAVTNIPTRTPISKPAVNLESVPQKPLNISKPEDLAGVTKSVLAQEFRKNFYTVILDLAGQYGYFQVLSFLEKSPLYIDYIAYGRIKLSNDSSRELALTQEEFEFVTDLLLALKVNRI